MIDESGQSSGFGLVTQTDTVTEIKKYIHELLSTLESLQRENEELRADNERLAKEAGYIGYTLSSTGDTHGN